MTLYRQLLAWVLLIFALMLAVVYSFEFQSTRDYLSSQQESEVINTSTSLGLALTPYLESGDRVGAESVINAIFDGGFYRQIELKMYNDVHTIQRTNKVKIRRVPAWFTSLELFEPVSHQQILTSGWLQLGELTLVGHPGFAYQQLWNAMTDLLSWFIVGFLLTVIAMMRGLQFLLKPLEQIRHQAIEIQKHHFGKPIPLPKTTELKEVVSAINLMSAKLAQQFKEQVAEAESLRKRAFQDSVSGLGNRPYFMGQCHEWIAELGVGGVLMIAVPRLEDLHREEGYRSRDQMVRSIAEVLTEKMNFNTHTSIARLSATEFAVLIPGYDGEQLKRLADRVYIAIADLFVNPVGDAPHFGAIGVAEREGDEDISRLLAKADAATQQGLKDPAQPVVMAAGQALDVPRSDWKRIVLDAVSHESMHFSMQTVTQFSGRKEFHVELYTGIELDGEKYHPGQFMPAIEQFHLGRQFDQAVLEAIAKHLLLDKSRQIAVNLTVSALLDKEFRIWLVEFLARHKAVVENLALEIPETAFVHHLDELGVVIDIIKQQGASIGVDQFGRHLHSLGYLEKVKPSYVKVDYGYTLQAIRDDGDTNVLKAICRAASNLRVTTIVQRIEDTDQIEMLDQLNIDAYQGYVAPPEPVALRA